LGDDLSSPEHGGKDDRGHPAPIVGVNIRVMVEEERHDRRIPFEGSTPERSLSAMIPAVDVGSMGKEHTGGIQMTVIRGEHQERILLVVGEIHGKTVLDHALEFGSFSVTGKIKGERLKLRVTLFLGVGG
jgi:hypothetical protein